MLFVSALLLGVSATAAAAPAGAAGAVRRARARPAVNWKIAGLPKGWLFRSGVSSATRARTLAPLGKAMRSAASSNPACSGCSPPLLFTPNAYVMGGESGTPGVTTITPVFWAPSGYSFPGTYESVIGRYLSDVAAASGTNGNVFSVAEQYYQQIGAGPDQYLQYHVTADPQIADGAAFPPSGCSVTGYTACITDAQEQAELTRLAGADSLTVNDSNIYMVFFPPNVATCFNSGPAGKSNPCSTNVYCAYHGAYELSGSPLIYANMPYPALNGCGDPWDGAQSPNGNPYADAMISLISHEYNEAITDWDGAWFDSNGNEDGDECAYVYGAPLGGSLASGTAYNQVINGHYYFTQDEFSNSAYASGVGDESSPANEPIRVPGCIQRASASPVSDGAGTMTVSPSSVTASSSGNTLGFAYTAASGGTSNGGIDVAVPAGWSPPSTTGSAAGYTASTCGTVAVSSMTIVLTGVTLAGGNTCTIAYGSKASSGPGATAPPSATTSTFSTTEMSTSTGTLTALGSSPVVTVTPPSAAGMLAVTSEPPPQSVAGGSFKVGIAAETASGQIATGDETSSIDLGITAGTGSSGAGLRCGTDPVTVTNGVAAFTCSVNRPGRAYTLSAASAGLAPVTTSAFTVVPAASTTRLALSSGRVAYGHEGAEKLSVTVSARSSALVPTGRVTISAGSITVCAVSLVAGKGHCALGARELRRGTYELVAHFAGNADLGSSTSLRSRLVVTVKSLAEYYAALLHGLWLANGEPRIGTAKYRVIAHEAWLEAGKPKLPVLLLEQAHAGA